MTDTRTVWLVIAALLIVVLALIASSTYLVASAGVEIGAVAPLTALVGTGVGALAGILANTRGQGPPAGS